MKTIALIAQKGGVGKSTLTLNLACYLASGGFSVAIADTDPQGSLTTLPTPFTGVAVAPDPLPGGGFDFLLVDTSPRHDVQLPTILEKADLVLIPVKPGHLDLASIRATVGLLTAYGCNLSRCAIVLNMVQHRSSLNADMAVMLPHLGVSVLKTKIYQRVAYAQSTIEAAGVLSLKDEKAKAEIGDLLDEITRILDENP